MVDNQQVEQTSSANLAMATHELARLPPMLEVLKIQALLKAAKVQVNDIRNLALSFSTASARSRNPRGSRRDGGSRYHSGQIIQGGCPGVMLPSILGNKDHEISVADQLVRPTRRLINPYAVTPTTASTPISMPAITLRTVMPSDIRQNFNADRSMTTNTATPSASDHSPLSSRRNLAPS